VVRRRIALITPDLAAAALAPPIAMIFLLTCGRD
jgi:hypothetical protein